MNKKLLLLLAGWIASILLTLSVVSCATKSVDYVANSDVVFPVYQDDKIIHSVKVEGIPLYEYLVGREPNGEEVWVEDIDGIKTQMPLLLQLPAYTDTIPYDGIVISRKRYFELIQYENYCLSKGIMP